MVYHVIFAYASREQGLFNYVHNHLNEDQGSDVGFKFQLSIPAIGSFVLPRFQSLPWISLRLNSIQPLLH